MITANGQPLQQPLRVAYIMSRFPRLTETFILYEMLAVEAQGVCIEIYPLIREHAPVGHQDAQPLVERAHYTPFVSVPLLRANLRSLRRQPRAYLGALGDVVRATWGSRRFFLRSLVLFPKAVFLAERMVEDGIAHVHAHFASHPAAVAFIIHRLTGLPYSFTAHGSDLHRDQHMLREKVREAAFAVPISEYNRDVIVATCGPESADRLEVIHCGVDTARFEPNHNGQLPDRDRSLRLLCIGTLHAVKGQRYLIEAVAQLRAEGFDVTCDFVGDGPNHAILVQQVEQAGLSEAIRFHGAQTREQVIAHLGRADVLAAPSVPTSDGRREGIPVALMEAMASGLPVVASRLSGIPELVRDGETGLLAPPGDVDALAAKIRQLYDDPALRRALGMAGRAAVVRDFDLHRNAAALARRFQEVQQG
jgi:colanic acid/amylovoran biosynthesis glycosyltransferase